MGKDARAPVNHVIGPEGDVLTLGNLPSATTGRWVPRRKAEVVLAVRGGLLSFGEACRRYNLTAEEFLTWQDGLEQQGIRGLRATKYPAIRGARQP
jgi:hypothetical protein